MSGLESQLRYMDHGDMKIGDGVIAHIDSVIFTEAR